MKKMTSYITTMLLLMAAGSAMAATMSAPENPATGIWIQQVGDLVPHASSRATLYYTKYQNDGGKNDRVKSISYTYNGNGYLFMKPSDKKTVCSWDDGVKGADGIVEHPDGDLLIAGQEQKKIYKIDKKVGSGTGQCVVKSASPTEKKDLITTSGIWHLMMDPTQKILWGAGIPGPLFSFSTELNAAEKDLSSSGYYVKLNPYKNEKDPSKNDYKQHGNLATIVWDGDGTAFFTYSDYMGGGCEPNHENCNSTLIDSRKDEAYFGFFYDTTYISKDDARNNDYYSGRVGKIKSFGTKILIPRLEGAHGATYDDYSKTIFVFGGSKIVQIKVEKHPNESDPINRVTAKVVAEINMREYFFEESEKNLTLPRTKDGGIYTGWRLDQGTVDGYGHLFVASNTGHMVFVDYTGNKDKLINDNVLVHVQWIDNFLDDVAPLKGVVVDRDGATEGSDDEIVSSASQSSSSKVVYVESSSSRASSSSAKSSSSGSNGSSSGSNDPTSSGSNGNSSGSTGSSSGSNGSSSGSNGDGSSGSNGSSSGSNGSSSGSNGGSSGSNGDGSSGSNGGSSGSNGDGSSGSNGGSSGSNGDGSSGSNGNGSSGSNGDGSSGSNGNGSSGSNGNGSSDSNGNGSSDSDGSNEGSSASYGKRSSSSRVYYGADDYILDTGNDFDSYPTAEDFEEGDAIVDNAWILTPTEPDPKNPDIKVINGNSYLLTNTPSSRPVDFRYNSDADSAFVGQVVGVTLDADKVKEYFGDADSLDFYSETAIRLIDPTTGETTNRLKLNADGSVTFFITSDEVVEGGAIKIRGGTEMVIIDNINFYDPIPDSRMGYIRDVDGDDVLDRLEVQLTDSLPSSYNLVSVQIVIGKDTLDCTDPRLNGSRDRVVVEDLSKLNLSADAFPQDAKAIVTYKDNTGSGAVYTRESRIVEEGSFIIKDAFAIRNKNGMDSLFLQFGIDVIPVDVGNPELLVEIKQAAERYKLGLDSMQIKKVYMPTKNIVILVAKTFGLEGNTKDSVSLYPGKTFSTQPYITSDEYDREVPVTVIDRFATVDSVEYWDTDGDGVLDQIVTVFTGKLTSEDIKNVYMSFPWYSSRGLQIQLQAQPSDFRINPKDSTRVIWDVHAATKLASGITVTDGLPEATIYTYYSVFGETFVNEETKYPSDKMSPVVANATLSYGSKADTLQVTFSEAILTTDLKGEDYFSYIHGGETIELNPVRIDWSADGRTAKLILDGSVVTIMPGDSLVVRKGASDAIKDNYGNVAGEHPQSVIIGGLLNHLVEATKMGVFDVNDDRIVDEDSNKTYTLQTVSSVNLRFVPGSTTREDMEKEGALGQLVQLGERFVPQLLDRAQIAADGSYDPSVLDSLKPEDVYISFVVNFTDHLGQFVNDTIITVPCNSPKFGGNCLSTDKKVFVNWNFKDHSGRFVGAGVYNVHFRMVVRYEDKKIEEEIKDKWGVRRKKGKHKK